TVAHALSERQHHTTVGHHLRRVVEVCVDAVRKDTDVAIKDRDAVDVRPSLTTIVGYQETEMPGIHFDGIARQTAAMLPAFMQEQTNPPGRGHDKRTTIRTAIF